MATQKTITVIVSPFSTASKGWTDEATGIFFESKVDGKPYVINASKNLKGIQNSIRLNNLMLIEGDLNPVETLDLDNIDPSQLSKEKLKEIVNASGAGNEKLEAQIAELQKEKTNLLTENVQLNKDKTALQAAKETLESQKTALEKDKNKLTSEKAALEIDKTNLTSEKTAVEKQLTDTKAEFFKKYKFTEEDLALSYYTAAIIKEIMTIKAIGFGASDNKVTLISKLIAGQRV